MGNSGHVACFVFKLLSTITVAARASTRKNQSVLVTVMGSLFPFNRPLPGVITKFHSNTAPAAVTAA